MLRTFADGFSGGGGSILGAIAAGLEPIWGIEKDSEIAEIGNANTGGHIIIGDILEINPRALDVPDLLHFSPPCPSFSTAKSDRKETSLDVAFAQKIIAFIDIMKPRAVTVENVIGYKYSQSFKLIMHALNRLNYFTHFAHLNSADFGVPQTRRRLILRAVRHGLVPMLPLPE